MLPVPVIDDLGRFFLRKKGELADSGKAKFKEPIGIASIDLVVGEFKKVTSQIECPDTGERSRFVCIGEQRWIRRGVRKFAEGQFREVVRDLDARREIQ